MAQTNPPTPPASLPQPRKGTRGQKDPNYMSSILRARSRRLIDNYKRAKDKGNPRPNMDNFKSVTEYFKAEDKWKKDNPLAAKREAQKAKKNVEKRKQRMMNREKPEPRPEGASPKVIEEWEKITPLTRRKWLSSGGKVYASSTRKANYKAG